jgi:drug/metabolite transporter (DMT)-like permease
LNGSYVGEIAALVTSVMWALSSILFTIGGRHVGAMIVNRTRLLVAVILVGGTHWVLMGAPFPQGVEAYRYGWLALSALIGLVLGDSLLFKCYLMIGPRIGTLLLSLSPIFGALGAWALLSERLSLIEVGAMGMALAGMAWVVLERDGRAQSTQQPTKRFALGVLLGIAAGGCQALGLVVAKLGLGGDFPALSAVMIRMFVAMVVMWAYALLRGEALQTFVRLRQTRPGSLAILAGSITGPFIGVWLSLFAVQTARVGIASTLMAMTPVVSLPLVRIFFGEQISRRVLVGTFVAMAGVAVMILV